MNIGDKVKVIPISYVALSKGFFNNPSCWKESQGRSDDEVMLGGVYEILGFDGSYARLLDDNSNNKGLVQKKNLQLVGEVETCPYRIGDKVVFSPSCSSEELAYIAAFSESSLGDKTEHMVVDILNEYYLFIDHPITSELSYPFRWLDFSLPDLHAKC